MATQAALGEASFLRGGPPPAGQERSVKIPSQLNDSGPRCWKYALPRIDYVSTSQCHSQAQVFCALRRYVRDRQTRG